MNGYIYCFSNRGMSGLCKCGGTERDPFDRCKELFNTSMAFKCNVEYFIKVSDWRNTEKLIHDEIVDSGIKRCDRREWFMCNPGDIKHIFDKYDEVDGNMKKIKINNIKKYSCKDCNYNTNKKSDYTRHQTSQRHKRNSQIIYTCEKCEKEYTVRSSYYAHRKKCIIIQKEELTINTNNTETDFLANKKNNKEIDLLIKKNNELEKIKKDFEIQKLKIKHEKEKNKILQDFVNYKNNQT